MKNITYTFIALLLFISCSKEIDTPILEKTLVELAAEHKPSDLGDYEIDQTRILLLDTNIASYYTGYGEYFPYVEYSAPQDPINISNLIHGGNPYGDLRGAMDTVTGVKYRAYWFDAFYNGLFRNFIIYTKANDENQNWVYTIDQETNTAVLIAGETFVQTPTGNNPFGYGTMKVYNSTVAITNVGPYDVNPLIDSQGKLYVDAYWDLEVQLIDGLTGDTLKGRSYSFIRTESIPPTTITGVGRLKAADPALANGLFPTYDISPYEILYNGNLVTVFIYPGALHSFALGAGNTSNSTIIVQGFFNGDLINIPMSRFSKIIYKSNRGQGASYPQY